MKKISVLMAILILCLTPALAAKNIVSVEDNNIKISSWEYAECTGTVCTYEFSIENLDNENHKVNISNIFEDDLEILSFERWQEITEEYEVNNPYICGTINGTNVTKSTNESEYVYCDNITILQMTYFDWAEIPSVKYSNKFKNLNQGILIHKNNESNFKVSVKQQIGKKIKFDIISYLEDGSKTVLDPWIDTVNYTIGFSGAGEDIDENFTNAGINNEIVSLGTIDSINFTNPTRLGKTIYGYPTGGNGENRYCYEETGGSMISASRTNYGNSERAMWDRSGSSAWGLFYDPGYNVLEIECSDPTPDYIIEENTLITDCIDYSNTTYNSFIFRINETLNNQSINYYFDNCDNNWVSVIDGESIQNNEQNIRIKAVLNGTINDSPYINSLRMTFYRKTINESESMTQMISAIESSEMGNSYISYYDKNIYVRLANGSQYHGVFDIFIMSGNKRYAFNYDENSSVGFPIMYNISPVFYFWQGNNMTGYDVKVAVKNLIDSTY